MKLNKKAIDLIRAEKQIEARELIQGSCISSATLYAGYKKDIDPLAVGRIAKTLQVNITDIIQ